MPTLHPLQAKVEERKDCFLEHVVRRAWLLHPGWIEERGWSKKDADRFYKITTVCDILRYVPPRAHACAALVHGSKPLTPLKAEPPHRIYEALARLELVSRHPERRAELFDWEKAGISKREYWNATVGDLADQLLLLDNADFGLNILLRLVYLFGALPPGLNTPWLRPERQRDPKHPAQIPIDPDFDEDVQAAIQKALLNFKYWHDESFRVIDEPICRDRRRDKNVADKEKEKKEVKKEDRDRDDKQYQYEMQYWSENHQILFATAEYLAGQLLPTQVFKPGAEFRSKPATSYRDLTGKMRMARSKDRLIRWLDDRLRFGFSEWNAPGYYDEHFTALINLADFCLDEQIRNRAMMVLDLLIYDLARFTHAGSFSVSAGRAHFKHKNCGWHQSVSDVIELLFHSRGGVFVGEDGELSGTGLVTSRRYDVPEVLLAIGQDKPMRFVDRSRVSIEFQEGAEYGMGFDREEDILRWWSRAAWFAKYVVAGTQKLVDRYGLGKTKPYSDILPKLSAGAAVVSGAGVLGYVAAGPVAAPLLGNPFESSSDIADSLSVITEGSAYTRGNLYTYRNRDAMLSSALNHRAGQLSFQGHNCQATLSMCATVFTSHPSAGGGIDESIAQIAGTVGGGLLGSALGGPAGMIGGAIIGNKALDKDIILLEADSDGPDWWTGSITQPRVMQMGNAAILAYNPKAFQLALFGHRTHAWFPMAAFDPDPPPKDPAAARRHIPSRTAVPSRNSNVDTGAWIFGKAKEGGGFIGLYSGQRPVVTTDGDWAHKEIVAEGKRNIFIIQIGNADEFGSYEMFKERVLSARIHINGLHWHPSDFQCSYDRPGGSRLELHYDDQVRYAGAQVSDDEHPRYDNPHARVAWQQNRYVINQQGHSLLHDIRRRERRTAGSVSALTHAVPLTFQAQNMGLFHHIPPYNGKDRDGALRKLIEVLRAEQPDVVGLSEMWHGPDRDKIRDELGSIYPYTMEGPQGSDFVRGAAIVGGIGAGVAAGAAAGSVFGPAGSVVGGIVGGILGGVEGKDAPLNGGLMLLSRHPIARSNRTIYHQSAGEDSLSFKGVLHARIRPHGHPCEYDIFLSHTQNLAPIVGEDDAKGALGQQIRHLAAFIRSCREPAYPALLMGDLNVDAFDPSHKGLLDLLHREMLPGVDMVPQVRLPADQTRVRPQATSESDGSHISAFNEKNAERADNDAARFGASAQRLDYFFTWPGLLYEPHFADDAEVLVIQSSPGKDLSDHYGIRCKLTQIVQRLPGALPRGISVSVKPIRFRCLNTTDGPGSDELEFTIRCVTANGQERSVTSKRFEDVDQGSGGTLDLPAMRISDPDEFVMITASGKEIDTLSADDSLGTTQLTLDWRELAVLSKSTINLALPRLTGDGAEYVLDVEIAVSGHA